MLKSLKKMGLTMGFRVRSDMMFDVADEVGMLFDVNAGSMVSLNIWNPLSGLTNMSGKENAEEIARLIKRWREHPSIISWHSNAPYCLISMHPHFAGQNFETWNYFPANRNAPRAREGQLLFKKMGRLK